MTVVDGTVATVEPVRPRTTATIALVRKLVRDWPGV